MNKKKIIYAYTNYQPYSSNLRAVAGTYFSKTELEYFGKIKEKIPKYKLFGKKTRLGWDIKQAVCCFLKFYKKKSISSALIARRIRDVEFQERKKQQNEKSFQQEYRKWELFLKKSVLDEQIRLFLSEVAKPLARIKTKIPRYITISTNHIQSKQLFGHITLGYQQETKTYKFFYTYKSKTVTLAKHLGKEIFGELVSQNQEDYIYHLLSMEKIGTFNKNLLQNSYRMIFLKHKHSVSYGHSDSVLLDQIEKEIQNLKLSQIVLGEQQKEEIIKIVEKHNGIYV